MSYIVREAIAAYLERSKVQVDAVHPERGGVRPGAGRPSEK